MSNDNGQPSIAELKQANIELRKSLKRCEALVTECRERLQAQGEASFLLDPRARKSIKS